MKNNKTIIVLGSPRSGTSLTAGILFNLGIYMGNIREPDMGNPRGYFEDHDFQELGKKIYKTIDDKSSAFSFPDRLEILKRKDIYRDEIISIVDNRDRNYEKWGWKTIITNYLIDIYKQYINNPYFIVVLRNPLDVARSLEKYTKLKSKIYNQISVHEGININIKFINRIMEFYQNNKDLKFLFISFEDLNREPKRNIEKIINFIEISPDDNSIKKAINTILSKEEMFFEKQKEKIKTIKRKILMKIKKY